MTVRYYGACSKLKSEDKQDKKLNQDSYLNCEVHNELASKDVLVEVRVSRPEVSGKKQINDRQTEKKNKI